MAITVRRLDLQEWASLRQVRLRALAGAPDAFASTAERESALGEDEWQRRTATAAFAVDEHGRVVGLVGWHAGPDDPTELELVGLWVEPDARRAGVAAALVAEVVSHATATGCRQLWLSVIAGHDDVERLYRRLGFTRTGEEHPAPDGRRTFDMARVVGPDP